MSPRRGNKGALCRIQTQSDDYETRGDFANEKVSEYSVDDILSGLGCIRDVFALFSVRVVCRQI